MKELKKHAGLLVVLAIGGYLWWVNRAAISAAFATSTGTKAGDNSTDAISHLARSDRPAR
jgi:hypothetical protein